MLLTYKLYYCRNNIITPIILIKTDNTVSMGAKMLKYVKRYKWFHRQK